MSIPDYATRVAQARDALDTLADHAAAALPTSLADQMGAAARDAADVVRQVAEVAPGAELVEGVAAARALDMQARVVAVMADGEWHTCPHLRRTPAQPTYVLLPNRRLTCRRCAATVVNPPADESDRCDLCGARGLTTFWPLTMTVAYWTVVGDTCRDCAQATGHPGATDAEGSA